MTLESAMEQERVAMMGFVREAVWVLAVVNGPNARLEVLFL